MYKLERVFEPSGLGESVCLSGNSLQMATDDRSHEGGRGADNRSKDRVPGCPTQKRPEFGSERFDVMDGVYVDPPGCVGYATEKRSATSRPGRAQRRGGASFYLEAGVVTSDAQGEGAPVILPFVVLVMGWLVHLIPVAALLPLALRCAVERAILSPFGQRCSHIGVGGHQGVAVDRRHHEIPAAQQRERSGVVLHGDFPPGFLPPGLRRGLSQ